MLILSVTIAFLLLGVLWLAAVLHEHGLKPMRRMAELMKRPAAEIALVALVAIGMIHHGATKCTNGVNGTGGEMGGTNGVQNMGGVLTGLMGLTGFGDGGGQGRGLLRPLRGSASGLGQPDRFATGASPALPTTNYQLPTTNLDWQAFGGYEDWFYLDGGGWCFRFGSNLVERLTVFSCGEISPAPYDESNRISLLGLPLAILPAANWHLLGNGEWGTGNGSPQPSTLNPQQSLFCHEETPSNTLLLTWRNALVNRDTDLPVTVQAELFPDGAAAFRYDFSGIGDISALSNAEAQIWRDGVLATNGITGGGQGLPALPEMLETGFDAPPITGTNLVAEVYARIAGGNSNAYYCADVVVEKGPAKIRVESLEDETNQGLLGAYEIVAMPGETNRLPLLIGPKYAVKAESAFGSFELVPPPFLPIGADTNGVEWRMFGDAMTVTNITDRLVEVSWPVACWLRAIDATPGTATYALRVTPDWLCGTVTWHGIDDTNAPPMRGSPPMRSGCNSCSCGCLARDIDHLIHSLTCFCDHCHAEGEYGYEGHSKVVSFDMKDIGNGGGGTSGDEGGDDDPPLESPWVSVAFEDSVVIFENEYTNSPGVTVPRRSTRTKLTLTAHGGDFGCAFTYQAPDAEKMLRVGGDSPPPSYVSADSDIEWTAYYEGIKASTQMNDLHAMVTYTDPVTGQTLQPCTDATVVEVKVSPMVDPPSGHIPHRRKFGLLEVVSCRQFPSFPEVSWTYNSGSHHMEEGSYYYHCPLVAAENPLHASIGNVEHPLDLTVIAPHGVEATAARVRRYGAHTNEAGYAGMELDLRVLPLDVSFAKLAIEEVPCDRGEKSGYFTNSLFASLWCHSVDNGAGTWCAVKNDNSFATDRAELYSSIPRLCRPNNDPDEDPTWDTGRVSWDVPFSWTWRREKDGDPPNPALYDGVQPVGQFATDVRHVADITPNGTVKVTKLSNWVSRGTNEVITLNGVVQ